MGYPRRSACIVGRKPLRHSAGTISFNGSSLCDPICKTQTRNCGRYIFRNQFGTASAGAHPPGLHPIAGFPRLSLLGSHVDGPVVSVDHGERVFSNAAAGNNGKTASRITGGGDPFEPARTDSLCRMAAAQHGLGAAMAVALVTSARLLPALHTAIDFSRTAAGIGVAALSHARFVVAIDDGRHAATLVFRQPDSVVNSQDPARDTLRLCSQLGSGNLALVSRAQQFQGSRVLGSLLDISAHACGAAGANTSEPARLRGGFGLKPG